MKLIDDIRTMLIGTAGFATQLSNIDACVKIAVGVLTACYLLVRIVKALRHNNEKD
jgi:hypothetical protein